MLHKLVTAAKLAARLDIRRFRRQLRINTSRWRLRRHRGHAFEHRDPGFPFICHPDWGDSVDQFCNNAGDHWEFELLRRWLEPADTVIDVGASLGLYTFCLAHSVGPRGHVIAVEAAPFVLKKLATSSTLLRTRHVVPVHAAVTDTPGTITFYVRQGDSITSEQSLRPSDEQRDNSIPLEVPAVTLAQLGREHLHGGNLSLVKLDIEGAEATALRTAPAAWLSADGPFWLLEVHPGALARFAATPRDIIDRFSPARFDRWLLAKHPVVDGASTELRALPDEAAITAIDFSRSLYYNFFAVPKGQRWRARADRVHPQFTARPS